jgi:hypothetical protein
MKIYIPIKKLCKNVHNIFIITAKNYKQPKCPGEWLNCGMHHRTLLNNLKECTIDICNNVGEFQELSYSTIWMNLNEKRLHLYSIPVIKITDRKLISSYQKLEMLEGRAVGVTRKG